jgi:hypothetical protein
MSPDLDGQGSKNDTWALQDPQQVLGATLKYAATVLQARSSLGATLNLPTAVCTHEYALLQHSCALLDTSVFIDSPH